MDTFTAFEILATGGNCSALVVTLDDGRALFITDGDAQAEPARDAYFIGLFPSYHAATNWEAGDECLEKYATPRGIPRRHAQTFAEALDELLGWENPRNVLHALAGDYMDASGQHVTETAIGRAILGMFADCADTYYLHNRG